MERFYDDFDKLALLGKTILKIRKPEPADDELTFIFTDGTMVKFCHQQDCCERVYIEDVCGDLGDLVGVPLILAEEVVSHDPPEGSPRDYHPDSETWTFYKFSTIKGSVTIRWFGESNGYYSESVHYKVHMHALAEHSCLVLKVINALNREVHAGRKELAEQVFALADDEGHGALYAAGGALQGSPPADFDGLIHELRELSKGWIKAFVKEVMDE